MKRRLFFLNIALIAAAGWVGFLVRQQWVFAHEREARLRAGLAPLAASAAAGSTGEAGAPAPVTAATYLDVAQRMLFSKERNPQVIVETPAPEPPKPLPPLPAARGVMDIGDGPFVLMAENATSRYRAVRPGDAIGGYRLTALDGDQVTLEFEDRKVRKRLDELKPKSDTPAGGEAPKVSSAAAAPATPAPPPQQARPEPGAELRDGIRACVPGDSSPGGTVANGYRKVLQATPFGESCRWEPVK